MPNTIIGFIITLGTIIEQDQNLDFYKENYPRTNPPFGFLTWQIITFFNLNSVYNAWWFIVILFLFGSSLLACTFTTQLPSLRTFKLWKFIAVPIRYKELNVTDKVRLGFISSIAYNCNTNRYHFFRQNKKGYAYSGLLGRLGPIFVHGSIILLLFGSTVGVFGGYNAQEMIPRGEIFHIQNLTKYGNVAHIPQAFSCRINNFWITYTKELETDQFYSDISVLNEQGTELKRKVIFVNEPLIFKNLVLYQTDWDIVGIQLRFQNNKIFQMPVKKVTKNNKRFWFGSLNVDNNLTNPLTVVVSDLRGKIYLYDSRGKLHQESFIGGFTKTNKGVNIQFYDFITSAGLQIKSDPGLNTVYFAFFLLIVSIYVSFLSYSQIWLLETSEKITVGGNSNRAVLFFQEQTVRCYFEKSTFLFLLVRTQS